MTIENKLDCTWLFVNIICCTGMTSFLHMMIFQWIVYIRNQTHALYIEYFNPEASSGNKMPSCVLRKNIIVDVLKLNKMASKSNI
jgi:hypothetical protein